MYSKGRGDERKSGVSKAILLAESKDGVVILVIGEEETALGVQDGRSEMVWMDMLRQTHWGTQNLGVAVAFPDSVGHTAAEG